MGAHQRKSKRAKTQRKQFSELAEDEDLAAQEDHQLKLAIELSKRTRSHGSAKQDPLPKVITYIISHLKENLSLHLQHRRVTFARLSVHLIALLSHLG